MTEWALMIVVYPRGIRGVSGCWIQHPTLFVSDSEKKFGEPGTRHVQRSPLALPSRPVSRLPFHSEWMYFVLWKAQDSDILGTTKSQSPRGQE